MPPIGQAPSTPPSRPTLSATNSTQTRLPLWKKWAHQAVVARHQRTFNNPIPTPPPYNHNNGYIDGTPNNGYLEIGEKLDPPQNTQKAHIHPLLTHATSTFLAATGENSVRLPVAAGAANFAKEKSFSKAWTAVSSDPLKAFGGTPNAVTFGIFMRTAHRTTCFELPKVLKKKLEGQSDSTILLASTVAVTAAEVTLLTPVERASLLQLEGKTKSFFDAFKGEHRRNLIDAYRPFVAVLSRNSIFNTVMVAAIQFKPDEFKGNRTKEFLYKLGAASLCVVASQPAECFRFECTGGKPYKEAAKLFLTRGLIDGLFRGATLRYLSVGLGMTAYWELSERLPPLLTGQSKA